MNDAKNILLVAALAVCLLAGCSSRGAVSPDRNPVPTTSALPITVHVFEVQAMPGVHRDELVIPAALSVEGTALVLAQREGRIVTLRAQEGARVTKGEVLAQFNDDDQRSQLRQADIEIHRLQVEEQQFEALVKLNRSELDRELALARDGVSSKADVERAQYKLDQAVKEHEKTKLATEGARARAEAVKLELEKGTVKAPIAGVVIHRYVALGTNVARNEKLFEVSKLAPLEVRFQIPQTEKERLSPGRIVDLSLVASDRLVARARIRRIDPVADATNNTFGYLADIIGGSGLMPGLAVNVHLPRAAGGISFWIPRAAFPSNAEPRSGGKSTLLVLNQDKCSVRVVDVNTVEGDQIEVINGLAPGDRVILSPSADLKEGDRVEVKKT